jgi:hypothetical protein
VRFSAGKHDDAVDVVGLIGRALKHVKAAKAACKIDTEDDRDHLHTHAGHALSWMNR